MNVNTQRINLVHLMNVLGQTTADRMVALYVDKPKTAREAKVCLSNIGQDVMVTSKASASIMAAGADEVIISRVFKAGPAIFITGCNGLDHFFKKKEGADIMGATIEALNRVKGKDRQRTTRLHLVGPTEKTYVFMNGRFIPFTDTTNIVVTDLFDGRFYGIRQARGESMLMSADQSRFDFGDFIHAWHLLAATPAKGDIITWVGKVEKIAPDTVTMDVRFNGRRGRLLQVKGNAEANWKPEHDSTKALALVDYGTPAILAEDHDAASRTINMKVVPVKDLPSAFRGYVSATA